MCRSLTPKIDNVIPNLLHTDSRHGSQAIEQNADHHRHKWPHRSITTPSFIVITAVSQMPPIQPPFHPPNPRQQRLFTRLKSRHPVSSFFIALDQQVPNHYVYMRDCVFV